MEVDNCQNSNFCRAVFSNGSLCMSGSPECLCQCGSGGGALLQWLLPGMAPLGFVLL